MSTKCPRCGKRTVVDGGCFLCGFRELPDIQTPKRTCITCGRKLRFDGIVCDDCTTAIQLGSVTLRKTMNRNLAHDRGKGKPMRFASCPAGQVLDKLAAQFRAERAARRKARQKARQKWWSNPENRKKAYEHKLRVHHERMATDPEYRERCRLAAERYRRKRDADPVRRERARAKGRECAARYRASGHGQAIHKAYYESHKEHLVEYQREFRKTHPEYVERMRAWSRDYYWAHREEINAQKLERYRKYHREWQRNKYWKRKLEKEDGQ